MSRTKQLYLKFDVRGNPKLSKAIQLRLFELNCAWPGSGRTQFTNADFLYVSKGYISWSNTGILFGQTEVGDGYIYFKTHKASLSSLNDLYELEVREDKMPDIAQIKAIIQKLKGANRIAYDRLITLEALLKHEIY